MNKNKIGRPLTGHQPKDKRLVVLLTENGKKDIEKEAKKMNILPAEYVRMKLGVE